MQTELFPSNRPGLSFEAALQEYKQLNAKGNKVHLVYLIEDGTYSTSYNSEKFIKEKLTRVYEFIK